MKKLRALNLTTLGRTFEPNSPNIVATRKNILSPPPILIEYFERLNQQDAKNDIPLNANIVTNAPTLSNISSPYVNAIFVNGKISIDGDEILLGGNSSYEAVCFSCYEKLLKEVKKN